MSPVLLDLVFRCCGRKPLHYKTGRMTTNGRPQLFCVRCDASYNPATLEQQDNWAWTKNGDGKFVRRKRHVTTIR